VLKDEPEEHAQGERDVERDLKAQEPMADDVDEVGGNAGDRNRVQAECDPSQQCSHTKRANDRVDTDDDHNERIAKTTSYTDQQREEDRGADWPAFVDVEGADDDDRKSKHTCEREIELPRDQRRDRCNRKYDENRLRAEDRLEVLGGRKLVRPKNRENKDCDSPRDQQPEPLANALDE